MDKSRQQFEEEFRKHSTLDKDDIFKIDSESDDYYYLSTRWAWRWWEESRKSLINNLEPVGCMTKNGVNNIKKYGFTYIYDGNPNNENIPLYRLDK